MNYKNKILEYINSTVHYNSTRQVADKIGCSFATAHKWLKELVEKKEIRVINIGIGRTPNHKYMSIETSERIRKSKNRYK